MPVSARAAGMPRSAWVAAIARPPAARCGLERRAKRRLRRRIEGVQRLVEQPERRPARAPPAPAPPGGAGRPTGCARAAPPGWRDRRPPGRRPGDPSAGGAPRSRSAARRFSRTERSPLRPSRWPSQASRPRQASGSARTSAPCQRMVPASGRTSRASARNRVVLPLPLRPVSASSSPAPRAKDRRSNTGRPPRRQDRSVTSRTGDAMRRRRSM